MMMSYETSLEIWLFQAVPSSVSNAAHDNYNDWYISTHPHAPQMQWEKLPLLPAIFLIPYRYAILK